MHLIHFLLQLIWLLGFADSIPARIKLQRRALETSPPFYPSPWMDPHADGWVDAYAKAKEFVSQLTLLEKVNLTTGIG
jgi:hypothetical protein